MRWSATNASTGSPLVGVHRLGRAVGAGGEESLGGEDAGEQRLADALARHGITRGRGVADERGAARREHDVVDPSRDGPRPVG